MSTLRFTLGTSFVWEQMRYEVAQLLPDHHVRLLNPNTGSVRVVPLLELPQALLKKTLHIDSPTQETSPDNFQELSDYTVHQIDTARYRLRVIQPLIKNGSNSPQLAAIRMGVPIGDPSDQGDENCYGLLQV